MGFSRYASPFVITIFIFTLLRLGNTSQKTQQWSFLVLARRWPPSACLDIPHGKCLIPKYVNNWIIHGLWPTSEHGYPEFCNRSWRFTTKDIESVLGGLEAKWPNIMKGTGETSFWKHEWDKHGTCAASVTSMDSVLKYFSQTMELHDKFNFYDDYNYTGSWSESEKDKTVFNSFWSWSQNNE